jgi:hypothetical protein
MASNTQGAQPGNNQVALTARITFADLQRMSDDPARDDQGGSDLKAVLHYDPERGFSLLAQDQDKLYEVTQGNGESLCFRTIEVAISELQDVPGLHPAVTLVWDLAVLQRGRG